MATIDQAIRNEALRANGGLAEDESRALAERYRYEFIDLG